MAKKHTGTFESCNHCQYAVEGVRGLDCEQDWTKYLRKLHNAAIRRAVRDDIHRACGLVKVRGALGGTYWE